MPPIGTNAFALIDEERKECVFIDAPLDSYEWATGIAQEKGYEIVALILTHGHWDHILDGWKFSEAGIPAYGHASDTKMFAEPSRMSNYAIPGLNFSPVKINHWVQGGRKLDLLGTEMEIRHVPGHCPGNILVYVESAGAAIVGDAIFAGSIGRYDLPGGDFKVLEKSIREQIYSLPEDTVIYPGHGPSTSVAQEKASNSYVRP